MFAAQNIKDVRNVLRIIPFIAAVCLIMGIAFSGNFVQKVEAITIGATTYTTDTHWTLANSPYTITGAINVNNNATLTIDPGVVVNFNSGMLLTLSANADLVINTDDPSIPATGPVVINMAGSGVVFTVNSGSTIQINGTSLVNNVTFKHATVDAIAGWNSIKIMDGASATVNYATIKNADVGLRCMGTCNVTNSIFQKSRVGTAVLNNGSLTTANNTFHTHTNAPVSVEPGSTANFGQGSEADVLGTGADKNTYNGIGLGYPSDDNGANTGSLCPTVGLEKVCTVERYNFAGEYMPYVSITSYYVNGLEDILRFEPGVVVKALSNSIPFIINTGYGFDVNGTAELPVVITAITDDAAGSTCTVGHTTDLECDTNIDLSATTPVLNSYQKLSFGKGVVTIDHLDLRYSYAGLTHYGTTGGMTINDSIFYMNYHGFVVGNGASITTNRNTFNKNTIPIGIDPDTSEANVHLGSGANADVLGVGANKNTYNGISLSYNSDSLNSVNGGCASVCSIPVRAFAGITNATYLINTGYYLSGATDAVEVAPDVTLKIVGNQIPFVLNGASSRILLSGTAGHEVTLTSVLDDTVGYGGGAGGSGIPGDTNNDGSATTPAVSNWQYLDLRGAGYSKLSFASIRYGGDCLYFNAFTYTGSVENPTVTDSTIRNCTNGIRYSITNAAYSPIFVRTNVENITTWGAYNGNSTVVTVSGIYWGDATGPADSDAAGACGVASGSGEPIRDTVTAPINYCGSYLTVRYNTIMSPGQYRADGSTAIALGGTTSETSMVVKYTVNNYSMNAVLTSQVELEPVGTAFDGVPTASGSVTYSGVPVIGSITVNSLVSPTNYHWQVRVCDIFLTNCSPWVSYGENDESATDFTAMINYTPYDPTNLGPAEAVSGDYTNDSTPTFTFDLSDQNDGDTVKYQIQIATDSGFTAVVTDYTSALGAQGSFTFTVGQAAGGGAYTTGGGGQALVSNSYYWRVKAIDYADLGSSYVAGNAGAVAFIVDVTGPTTPGMATTTTPTSNNLPLWTWTPLSTDAGVGLANPTYTVQWSMDSSFLVGLYSDTTNVGSFQHVTPLAAGRWYVRVRAADLLGNNSSYSAIGNVMIDQVAPITTDSLTNSNWHNTPFAVVLTCEDIGSGCSNTYYTTDGSDPTTSSASGTSILISTNGVFTIKYFSVDNVTPTPNQEAVKTSSYTANLDITPPAVPTTLSTTTPTSTNTPTWTWGASSDGGSGLANPTYTVQWSQDSGFSSGVSSATVNVAQYTHSASLAQGTWYFRVRATDIAGNNSNFTANGTVFIDNTEPTLAVVTPIRTYINDTTPNFVFSSDEAGTTSYAGSCASATTAATSGNNTITLNTLAEGTYSNCSLIVTDNVGNASDSLSIPTFTIDTNDPDVNASATELTRINGDLAVNEDGWINNVPMKFTWTPGQDNTGGSGLKGYCAYLGDDPGGLPASTKGLLGTSPVDITNMPCSFIASPTVVEGVATLDLSNEITHGDPWLTSDSGRYYLRVLPVDNAGNIRSDTPETFSFYYDATAPTNVTYVAAPGGNFVSVADMNFTWPVGNPLSAVDNHSGLLGYQYQVNALEDDGWKGTDGQAPNPQLNINYIPAADSIYNLTVAQDGSSVILGDNTIYFRTVDVAGNYSSSGTYRTANISYGGEAPSFELGAQVTITPGTSTENMFAISWPEATAAGTNEVATYYYMINTTPPANLTTLEGNASTYISNGTSRTVAAQVLKNVNNGTNTITVVAVDDHDNYSPSNKIVGTFTLNSTNPDPVIGLFVSDASIKEASLWRASVSWLEPAYKGTGTLTYIVQRSTNSTDWTEIARTTGLSYVDTVPTSQLYYWRVGTIDTSDVSIADPSFTNSVSVTPRGRYSSPATLVSGPTVTDISTKRATISWGTDRASDSRVIYGLTSGEYFDVEAAISTQVTSHSIQLINLKPGTSYFYKLLWTDEDGNVGESQEQLFQTAPQPIVTNVKESEVGLYSALLSFTVKGAVKVSVDYGKSLGYGAQASINTSTNESNYTVRLNNLEDGTPYHYRISLQDTEGDWYQMEDHIITTIPRPRISNVRIQQVRNTASSTVQVSWDTNVETTSVITYSQDGSTVPSDDKADTKFAKGEHKMLIAGLYQESTYTMQVKARDRYGNEATSDIQKFTTAVDTRPPAIFDIKVEGENSSFVSDEGGSGVQLVISWSTDEPATSQIEFAEGAGSTYTNATFEDATLTSEHMVVLPNLSASKVYHLRVISTDKADNKTFSYDIVTVTPKTSDSAVDLIFNSLRGIFNF